MQITDYIPNCKYHAVDRWQLADLTGMTDRMVRREIQKAREEGALILNAQDGKGYYLATETDLDDIERQYRQDCARAMSILKRSKAMRQILRKAGRI